MKLLLISQLVLGKSVVVPGSLLGEPGPPLNSTQTRALLEELYKMASRPPVPTSSPITENNIKKVEPINDVDNEHNFISKQSLKHAAWLNMLAKIMFIVFLILFNFIFWMIALFEHFKSSDAIISSHSFH